MLYCWFSESIFSETFFLVFHVKIIRCNLYLSKFEASHLYNIILNSLYNFCERTYQIVKTIIWYYPSYLNTLRTSSSLILQQLFCSLFSSSDIHQFFIFVNLGMLQVSVPCICAFSMFCISYRHYPTQKASFLSLSFF